MRDRKIQKFTDLITWQKAHSLPLRVYSSIDQFPKYERYGLSSQLSRAVTSVTSNIAEGFGRHSFAEKIRFYRIAKGSLYETANQIIIARDVQYISSDDSKKILDSINEVSKLLQGLINKTEELKR